MANITGLITINGKQVLEVDADPSSSTGTNAPLASLALYDSGSAGTLFIKTGSADTAWQVVSTVTAEDIQDVIGGMAANTANVTLSYDDAAGQLSADLTNTAVTSGSYGSASSVASFSVDTKGRLTAASNVAINITSSSVSDFSTAADARISAQKAQPLGLATLGSDGKIPSTQLPSYVDDVEEYANLASFPATGENGKIYVSLATNKTYRWSGSTYIEISPSEVTSVFGRSGAVSAQNGDYNASQITNTPAGNISATTLQAAINELDSEKQPIDATLTALAAFNSNGILVQTAADTFTARAIAAGTGISVSNGNGVSDNPSIAISNTGVTAGTYGSTTQVAAITVNQQGQITSASNQTLDHGAVSGLGDDDHTQYALLAGRNGGQTLTGGNSSGNSLTLSSTSNATKGKINLGSSAAIDEANTRLGVGTTSPETILHLEENNVKFNISANSTTTSGAVNAVITSIPTASNSVELVKVSITGLRTNGSMESVAYERTLRVKNAAGTVSIPTVQSDYTSEDSALSAANVVPIVNGSSVDIRVTGVASCDITWKAVVNRMR